MAKRNTVCEPSVVLLPPNFVLGEEDDVVETLVDEILTNGGRMLYENYLNDSIIPYSTKWMWQALHELLGVVDMNKRCNGHVPSTFAHDGEPISIDLDNMSRAMVPVKPIHDSRYTMVLSSLDSNRDEHTERSQTVDDSVSVTSTVKTRAKTPTERVIVENIPIVPLQEPERDTEAYRQDDERRRTLLKAWEASQQDQVPSSPGNSRTSPRKRRMQKKAQSALPTITTASPVEMDDGAVLHIDFAIFDVKTVDGRLEKRPSSSASTCSRPSRQRIRTPTPTAVSSLSCDFEPSDLVGNVIKELVLARGVKLTSTGARINSSRQDNLPDMRASSAFHGNSIVTPPKPTSSTTSLVFEDRRQTDFGCRTLNTRMVSPTKPSQPDSKATSVRPATSPSRTS
ncbi:hypothetical protein Ae201684P_003085 [Aphanomyces euteiches]|nr:hypothetical protein Ae201684P_003085 [Aphanomyces euteiches]KAH9153009.1 hypothetical protein AeRB84_004658 [Aphanomyces euteiches]